MFLSQDGQGELMINRMTGERYVRPLTEKELKEVKKEKRYEFFLKVINTLKEAEYQLDILQEVGIEMEEILEFALRERN